jgi:hypothetical protein
VRDIRIKGPRPTGLTVAAGEYSVAAEFVVTRLACNGHDEERTWHGLLAQKLGTGVTVAIQTKTASFGMNFQVNARCETPTTADNEWYVLVKLHEEGTRPSFYILPRNVVAGADLRGTPPLALWAGEA